MALDGDAALALKVHIVENLVLRLPFVDGARVLKQTVGQSALAVVDVRYDAEIADVVHLQIFMGAKIIKDW